MTGQDRPGVLCLDIGGSTVAGAVVFDAAVRGELVVRRLGPSRSSRATILDVVQEVRSGCTAWDRVVGVAAAVPGPFDHDTGTSLMTHKLQDLHGTSLTPDVSRATNLDVVWINDANAFGLGVVRALVPDHGRVLALTCGTGIGSAFLVRGRLVAGVDGAPPGGDVWNLPFRDGILEDHVSAKALLGSATSSDRLASPEDTTSPVEAPVLEPMGPDVRELAARARTGDRVAIDAFASYGSSLGSGLADVVERFAPDIVVIGGGVAGAGDLFVQHARSALDGAGVGHVPLVVTTRADLALLGAAAFRLDGVGDV